MHTHETTAENATKAAVISPTAIIDALCYVCNLAIAHALSDLGQVALNSARRWNFGGDPKNSCESE